MMNPQQSTAILIPAYDPDEAFPRFLTQLKAAGFSHIIVVDDGSREETRPLFDAAEKDFGAEVIRHQVNRGYGRATKTGLTGFLERFGDDPRIAGVITCDCDGQHHIDDVLSCARELCGHPDSLVWGCRDFSRTDIPFRSALGNRTTTAIFRRLVKMDLPDTQSGLRGIPTPLVRQMSEINGERFEYTTSMVLETVRSAIPLRTFPIETIYIDGNRSTHFRPVRDSAVIYAMIGRYLLSPKAGERRRQRREKTSSLRLLLSRWLLFTLLFALLMIGAYSFPDRYVNDHVLSSGEKLVEEGVYPRSVSWDERTMRDNYTEGYVLSMASHRGDHPISSAFLNPYYDNADSLAGAYEARLSSVADGIGKEANQSYGRYWQGHLILERPLLIVTDLHGIYVVMAVLLGLLTLWACIGLIRRLGWAGPVILLLSLLSVNPEMIPSSTKFWYSFAIAVAGVGWICHFAPRYSFAGRNTSLLFFALGAITVFLDFMSTPILTFMLPFATLILLRREEAGEAGLGRGLLTGGRHFLFWFAGWGLLGLSNWILFSAVAAGNHMDGIEMIRLRWETWVSTRGMESRGFTRMNGIYTLISVLYISAPLINVFSTAGVISLLPAFLTKKRLRCSGILLSLTCAIPVAWCVALSTSVTDHAWAAYRMICGLIYVWLAAVCLIIPILLRRPPDGIRTPDTAPPSSDRG